MSRHGDRRTIDLRRFDRRLSPRGSAKYKKPPPERFKRSVFGGSRSATGVISRDVGAAVADDMFGALYDVDLEDDLAIEVDESYGIFPAFLAPALLGGAAGGVAQSVMSPKRKPEVHHHHYGPRYGEDASAPKPTSWKDSVPAPVMSAVQAVQAYIAQYMPSVSRHAVRGGYGMNGQPYAELVLEAHDPLNAIQQISAYALQVSGVQGVSISALPSKVPGQVRLIFSYGSVPGPALPKVPAPSKP